MGEKSVYISHSTTILNRSGPKATQFPFFVKEFIRTKNLPLWKQNLFVTNGHNKYLSLLPFIVRQGRIV